MFPSRVVPWGLVLATWGCVRADILRLDAAPRPQTQPAVVRVLGADAVLIDTGSLTRGGTGGDGGTILQLSGKVMAFTRVAPPAASPR